MKLHLKIEDRSPNTCGYCTIEIDFKGRSASLRKVIRQLSEDV